MVIDDISFLKTQDEKIAYKGLMEKAERANRSFTFVATDFLDPFCQNLADSVRNSFPDLRLSFLGGFPDAERKIAIFYPDFMEIETQDEYVQVLAFPRKDSSIQHRNVLGTILSLGLDRKVVGDIIISDTVYFVVTSAVKDFLMQEMQTINKHKICLKKCGDKIEKKCFLRYSEEQIIVPSLRVDSFISKVYGLSRSDAQKLIGQGKLKINFREEKKLHELLKEKSLISLRGYGRVEFEEVLGNTQKGNLRIKIKRLLENL